MGICRRERGKRAPRQLAAPCPWLTLLVHPRMEGSAFRPSFARASWPYVVAVREQALASPIPSWATEVPTDWQGGQALGQRHLTSRRQKFLESCYAPEPAFGDVLFLTLGVSLTYRGSLTTTVFHSYLSFHELQGQRVDSSNGWSSNSKQIKQENQGVRGCVGLKVLPASTADSQPESLMESDNYPETAL